MKSQLINVNNLKAPLSASRRGVWGEVILLVILFLIFTFLIPKVASAATLQKPPTYNSGLVGYWTMDGKDINWSANTITDKSGNGGTGTITNMSTTTSIKPGKIGQGLDFDNIDDFVNISTPSNLNDLTALTYCAWIKPRTFGELFVGMIVAKGFSKYMAIDSSNLLNFAIDYDGASDLLITSNSAITYGTWHHVCARWDGTTSGASFYLNGSSITVTTTNGVGSPVTESGTPYTIGNVGGATRTADGILDEVRIYNRALSATEINALYKAGAAKISASSADLDNGTSLENGLVGHWTMDGKDINWTTNRMTDRSGNSNTASVINMSTTTSPKSGKIGQSLFFDGSNDYLNITDHSSINPSQMSISMWIYLPTNVLTSNNSIIDKDANTGFRIRCSTLAPCEPQFIFNSTFGADGSNLTARAWNHVVLVAGSNGSRFYVNGVAGTLDADAFVANGTGFDMTIGAGVFGNFNGYIDDVRMYSRALSASEVSSLYAMGSAKANTSKAKTGGSLDTGLVGYWSFNGPDINWATNKALDKSGNSNDGTINNMSTTTSPVAGKLGQALSFDGSNDEINLDNLSTFDFSQENAFTISAWVYPADTSVIGSIFTRGDTYTSVGGYTYFLAKSNTNGTRWMARVSDGTNSIVVNSDVDTVTPNVWQHIAMTWDGTTVRLYKNSASLGTAQGTFTGLWDGDGVNDRLTSIGASGANEDYWRGKIDEVRVYNRALSGSEIIQLYNMGR